VRALATIGLLAALGGSGLAHADGGSCQSGSQAVTAARAALAASRASLPARFALADALVEASCFHEAVHTLEDGESIHPRNAELMKKLRNTRSLVSEQEYFAGKDEAELAARVSRNLLRCTKLADVAACDEALKLKPADAEIHLARGDALLKGSRPGEAEVSYKRAGEIAAGDPRVATQLAEARTQRLAMRTQCLERGDDAALLACQGALSAGDASDFEIHARMASLLQQRNRSAAALASYIAAHALQPGDRGVALGIVSLTTGTSADDAVTLGARGSALVTLGRGGEALVALRQAQALSPSMPGLRSLIAQAEKLPAPAVVASVAQPVAAAPAPVLAAARVYSNAAEPSRSR
jgi:tetratricopeptide (TPR) repeat protein